MERGVWLLVLVFVFRLRPHLENCSKCLWRGYRGTVYHHVSFNPIGNKGRNTR